MGDDGDEVKGGGARVGRLVWGGEEVVARGGTEAMGGSGVGRYRPKKRNGSTVARKQERLC